MTLKEKGFRATPRAVPQAGGCSKSNVTMKKIDKPTVNEYTIMGEIKKYLRITVANIPQRKPTR